LQPQLLTLLQLLNLRLQIVLQRFTRLLILPIGQHQQGQHPQHEHQQRKTANQYCAERRNSKFHESRTGLLDVLYLFAHLLNQHLEVNGLLGSGAVLRLGAESISLTIEFLHQKIEPAPDRLIPVEHI